MTDPFQFSQTGGTSSEKFIRDTVVNLPTEHGLFKLYSYKSSTTEEVCLAIVKGNVSNQVDVPFRIHSSCITGDILGSKRCDCREQLVKSLQYIEKAGKGLVIYAFQEGRGIGIANKLKAYVLQENGLNTVEANLALGFPNDLRTYHFVKDVIRDLSIKSVALMTNNPDKVKQLEEYGIVISKRIPHQVEPCQWNIEYLKTKKNISGHMLTNIT